MATTATKKNPAQSLWKEFRRDYGQDAEQFPADTTINKRSGGIYLTRHLLSGRARLRDPEGKPVKMIGDIGRIGDIEGQTILAVWWHHGQKLPGWIPLPSIDAMMEWTLDSVCPTPDGRILEPDHPDSWLRILGLV
jgi:hypothetical protein